MAEAAEHAQRAGVPVLVHNAAASMTQVAAIAIVDVSTLDTFGAQRLTSGPQLLYAMFEAGLVDTISTDYAGGYPDSILLAIDNATKAGVVGLAAAIRMASANVADAIPGLADLVLTDPAELPRVRTVIMGGEIVVRDGRRVRT